MRSTLYTLLSLCLFMQVSTIANGQLAYSQPLPMAGEKVDLNALLPVQQRVSAYWGGQFASDVLLKSKLDSLQQLGVANLDLRGKTTYAIISLKTGDKVAAVKQLEALFATHPDDYTIASYLAWGYEFTGNNQEALEVLRKAQAITRQGNYGSDWIQERILEEKLGGQQYDKVIDLGIKDYGQWIIDKQYIFVRNPDSLKVQIAYQLHERTGYMMPPDLVVGQLVLDFADLVAKTESRQEAIPFYHFAVLYAPSLKKTMDARQEAIKAEQQEVQGTFRWASVVWAIPLLAFFAILFSWLRVMRRQKKQGPPMDR